MDGDSEEDVEAEMQRWQARQIRRFQARLRQEWQQERIRGLAGELLSKAKKEVEKTAFQWAKWLEKDCGVLERTASNYIRLYGQSAEVEAKVNEQGGDIARLTVRAALSLLNTKAPRADEPVSFWWPNAARLPPRPSARHASSKPLRGTATPQRPDGPQRRWPGQAVRPGGRPRCAARSRGRGCHLDRDMKALVAAQPFASVEVEEFCLERTPKTHGYLYRGVATK